MSRESALAFVAACIVKLLMATLRLRVEDNFGFTRDEVKGPVILCFWHNRILAITLSFLRKYPRKKRGGVTVLTSPSKDGEILAQLMAYMGMGAVRGSSSRRGSQALRELIRLVESGVDIAITPDGPRGPRYKLSPGPIALAQATGAVLMPVTATFSNAFEMKTWDGFRIPLPFSTVTVKIGGLISVPPNLSDEEFEAARANLEKILQNEVD